MSSGAAGSPAAPRTSIAATTPPPTDRWARYGPSTALQRAQTVRRDRRARWAAAAVLQRRLPGVAVPAHRGDAVLRALRRRGPAELRAQGLRPAGDGVRAAALPGGRLGVHPEGLHLA